MEGDLIVDLVNNHKDSDLVDLNLRTICKKLDTIKAYNDAPVIAYDAEGKPAFNRVARSMALDATRAQLIDISNVAKSLSKLEGVAEEVTNFFNIPMLSNLDVGITSYYAEKMSQKFIESFVRTEFEAIHKKYTEFFA